MHIFLAKAFLYIWYVYIYPYIYRQTSNMNRAIVGHKIVDLSEVSPVGAVPTTSSFPI